MIRLPTKSASTYPRDGKALHNEKDRPLRVGLVVRSMSFEKDYLVLANARAAVAASLKSVLVPVALATASTLVTS